MKTRNILAAVTAAAAMALTSGAALSQSIDIDQTSLEKTSPFDTPTPQAFEFGAGQYRDTPYGAPSMIPHEITGFKIDRETNTCLMCHGDPERIGKKPEKGDPSTMPESHWATVDGKKVMHPTRQECTICHAPQANVQPLVPVEH